MSAVVVRPYPCGDLSTPAQPYEEKALSRGLRAVGWLLCAQSEFKSPGGISPIFGELFVARRQVIGGAVATTVSSITVNSFGALKALRSLFSSLVNCVQQPTSGLSDGFKTFLGCVALVHDESSNRRKHISVVKE